jgi:chromosome segregation ATPase
LHNTSFCLITVSSNNFCCVHSKEEDIVLKITNKVKVLKHDLECKEQANKEMMETLTYLKTKNEDYARQLTQLSLTVDQLVNNKHESIKRMDEMKDELAAKKTIIDELIVEFDNQTTLLEEQKAENCDLTEQLQLGITKNDGLESEVQTLVATTRILENHLNEKKNTIETLSADINKLCTGCEEMSDDIDIKNQLLNEKVAENVNLAEQLRCAKSEISELKTAIQTLFMAVGTTQMSS